MCFQRTTKSLQTGSSIAFKKKKSLEMVFRCGFSGLENIHFLALFINGFKNPHLVALSSIYEQISQSAIVLKEGKTSFHIPLCFLKGVS